ncbi:hypothetical protein DMENIID0001_057600 [Sergentomyia squamirostris]
MASFATQRCSTPIDFEAIEPLDFSLFDRPSLPQSTHPLGHFLAALAIVAVDEPLLWEEINYSISCPSAPLMDTPFPPPAPSASNLPHPSLFFH